MLSRVADSCYWLSRYIERAETNARLLDVNIQLMLDFEDLEPGSERKHWEPILSTLEDQELYAKLNDRVDSESVIEFVTFSKENPNSIVSCISTARENARTVREQISSEMWEQLNCLYLKMRGASAREEYASSPYDFFKSVIEGSHLFQGITDATMTHGEGWQFIRAGKFLERADSTSRVLDMKYHILLPSGEQVGGSVDITQWLAVLRSVSAREAYLKIYEGLVAGWQVAEFLVLHHSFPRSIRFCVDQLDRSIHEISGSGIPNFANEAERLAGLLRSQLDYANVKDVFARGLHQYLDNTQKRLNDIDSALNKTYCLWQEEEPAAE